MLLWLDIPEKSSCLEECDLKLLEAYTSWTKEKGIEDNSDLWKYVDRFLPRFKVLVRDEPSGRTFFVFQQDFTDDMRRGLWAIPLWRSVSGSWAPYLFYYSPEENITQVSDFLKRNDVPKQVRMDMVNRFLKDTLYLVGKDGGMVNKVVVGTRISKPGMKPKRYVLIGEAVSTGRHADNTEDDSLLYVTRNNKSATIRMSFVLDCGD